MSKWLCCSCVVLFCAICLWLFTTGAVRAKTPDVLSLTCTDVAESSWSSNQSGNHLLTTPFDQQHFILIDLSKRKVFLDKFPPAETPNNPALGDVVLTGIGPTQIVVSNAASFLKPHADGVMRFTFTIDRLTGLFKETDETLDANNKVGITSQVIRLCGTDQARF